jgi:ketosteroid isomerase-like protein
MPTNDEQEVAELVRRYFDLGKTKDLEGISGFLGSGFHKFGESAPYDRRNLERATTLEQLYFANISDFEYNIEDLKVEVLGECALATFILNTTGMVIDDYSFRGATISTQSRVTVVLRHNEGRWKMIHQHISKFGG